MCSYYLTDEGWKGDQCKFKHERVNGQCLRCGSVYHITLAQCDHPGRQKNTKQGQGKPRPTRTTSKAPAGGLTEEQG